MKCTNKGISLVLILVLSAGLMAGCSKSYSVPYDRNMNSTAFVLTELGTGQTYLEGFASDLCLDDPSDYLKGIRLENSYAYGLFDLNDQAVLEGVNLYEELPPASLTKVMTAYVALKYGNLDDQMTATANCYVTESGATKFGIKEGDHLTLDQALNILLLASANDIALMIAEHIGEGSIDRFIEMMNEEAKNLGATHTHFVNPNGLHDEEHYTTVYDLYLIFNEAIKNDRFREIILLTNYSSTYMEAGGTIKNLSVDSTNQYLRGNQTAPEGITVLGGKTGTTNAAGSCLILYSKDSSGNPYISIILKADKRDNLYEDMNSLLEEAAH